MIKVTQTPNVGEHKLLFRGDSVDFKLKVSAAVQGKAYIRTNIGRARIMRDEIISHMGSKRTKPGQDWHDLPMVKKSDTEFSVMLALLEVGHFEAMCFFIQDGKTEPIWPGSENVSINVEPAEFYCANSIYCAFPRQFGPNKNHHASKPIAGLTNDDMIRFDKEGFTIIPPSGTFRDLVKSLDFIIYKLNCRILHMLPVNPTPTVYARMGRYGSPYASLDFTGIDPSLAEFDKKATPLEQFLELVDAIHTRNGKLIIDVAINHTGWAAKVHEEHPEWLVRKTDGEIVSPGAWGVVWGDLTELDHKNPELCEYLSDMFLTWTSRGVDGFRCDAGYMIPVDAWEYIIAKVRKHYPDTIFLLEGLGGDPAITINLLNRGNMNWAYSELFQNYSRKQIEGYVNYSHKIGITDGLLVHYAETHDNNRLASTSNVYAKMRTGLCALLSDNGCFGFTNGVEWYAKEKVDVHEASALNWGSRENQVDFISRINAILISHPAFYRGANIEFFDSGSDDAIALYRSSENHNDQLLIIINLNCSSKSTVKMKTEDIFKFKGVPKYDLITGNQFEISSNSIEIQPGEVICLSANHMDIEHINDASKNTSLIHDKIEKQRAKAMALDIVTWINNTNIVSGIELEGMGKELLTDPLKFCKKFFASDEPVPIINWKWPRDLKREVIIPPDHLFFISSPYRFSVSIIEKENVLFHSNSIRMTDDGFFIIAPPLFKNLKKHVSAKIKLAVYTGEKCSRSESGILYLADDATKIKTRLDNQEIRKLSSVFLDGNQRGGMVHTNIRWGEIESKYDAVLAANLNKDVPVDRTVLLSRFRGWLLRHGRSVELKIDNIDNFILNIDGGGTWNFNIPVGNGFIIALSISIVMVANKNAVRVSVLRHKASERDNNLPDEFPVSLVLRPDMENRSFHENTILNKGLEEHWKSCVKPNEKGFDFSPQNDRTLSMITTKGIFGFEPECKYGIYHKIEEERGMDKTGDLFSPGYFNIELLGGEHAEIIAQVITPGEKAKIDFKSHVNFKYLMTPYHNSFEDVVLRAIREFVVKRDDLKTVIAGFPWFLDWGRDTLICVRGLLTAGMFTDVRKILMQFARYEENGTLPNIIHGAEVGNRDTSDAQLWFFVACREYIAATDDNIFLSEKIDGNKTVTDALKGIAAGYINGTSNGIKVDAESGLVFSPPHFTWMDTNYPAGTPREGYPVEIQALWHYALKFLGELDKSGTWTEMADKVRRSVKNYFIVEEENETGKKTGRKYLSDCLHCAPGKKAAEASPDDHIRPNQIFALTLGLIDDLELSKSILDICCDYLIVPGAIRSLADKGTKYEVPIYGNNNGPRLNDPANPYWGRYEGDEDTRRKPAYHNGTAWTWPFPSYSEAYFKVYGNEGLLHARSILSSSKALMVSGCFGHLPEILDGDYPHKQRGCDAQAWGVTELYRVWKLLH